MEAKNRRFVSAKPFVILRSDSRIDAEGTLTVVVLPLICTVHGPSKDRVLFCDAVASANVGTAISKRATTIQTHVRMGKTTFIFLLPCGTEITLNQRGLLSNVRLGISADVEQLAVVEGWGDRSSHDAKCTSETQSNQSSRVLFAKTGSGHERQAGNIDFSNLWPLKNEITSRIESLDLF